MENLELTNTATEKLNTDDPVDYSGFDNKAILQTMLDNLDIIEINQRVIEIAQKLIDESEGAEWWIMDAEDDIASSKRKIAECKKHHNDMLRFLKPL